MQSCTIFCKDMDVDQLFEIVQSLFPSYGRSATSSEWWSAPISGRAGCLRITPLWFQQRGDDFSKLILSTISHVRSSEMKNDSRAVLTTHFEECELALGVVVEPQFDSDARYNDVVFAIARSLSGLVFNGDLFLNSEGAAFL